MKKEDILRVAIIEFGKHNYNSASINTIIENSNTSKGTFYHYFKSKELLYLELIKIVAQEKVNFLKEYRKKNILNNDSVSLFEMLKSKVATSMEFKVAYPEYATFSSQVANESNNDIKRIVKDIVGEATKDYLNKLINSNITEHKIRNDIPEEFVCELIMYIISQFNEFILNLKPDNTSLITDYLNYYIDFLENGLKYKNN